MEKGATEPNEPCHLLLLVVDIPDDLLHDAGVASGHRLDEQLLEQLLQLLRIAGNGLNRVDLRSPGLG